MSFGIAGLTTPSGYRPLEAFLEERVRARLMMGDEPTAVDTDGCEVVVLGNPCDEEHPNWEEGAHDCDAMGCGQCHVLLRINWADLLGLRSRGEAA